MSFYDGPQALEIRPNLTAFLGPFANLDSKSNKIRLHNRSQAYGIVAEITTSPRHIGEYSVNPWRIFIPPRGEIATSVKTVAREDEPNYQLDDHPFVEIKWLQVGVVQGWTAPKIKALFTNVRDSFHRSILNIRLVPSEPGSAITPRDWKDSSVWTPFDLRQDGKDGSRKIRPAEFQLESSTAAGYGGYGDVYKAKVKFTTSKSKEVRAFIAVKHIRPPTTNDPAVVARARTRAMKEYQAWDKLRHPGIAMLRGVVLEPEILLMSDWYEKGNILHFLQRPRPGLDRFDFEFRKGLMVELANAIAYLHSEGVIHGDLSHDQVMIDDAEHVKILDFGLSKVLDDPSQGYGSVKITTSIQHRGKITYLPPEIYMKAYSLEGGETYRHYKSDVYTMAIIFLEVATNADGFPGPDVSFVKTRQRITNDQILDVKDYPSLEETGKFWRLMKECTRKDPDQRPSAAECKERLEDMKWGDMYCRTLEV